MTFEEVKYLENIVSSTKHSYFNWKSDPVWKKAFSEYAKHNLPLSMSCMPCYVKILNYHRNQIQTQDEKEVQRH